MLDYVVVVHKKCALVRTGGTTWGQLVLVVIGQDWREREEKI